MLTETGGCVSYGKTEMNEPFSFSEMKPTVSAQMPRKVQKRVSPALFLTTTLCSSPGQPEEKRDKCQGGMVA